MFFDERVPGLGTLQNEEQIVWVSLDKSERGMKSSSGHEVTLNNSITPAPFQELLCCHRPLDKTLSVQKARLDMLTPPLSSVSILGGARYFLTLP